MAKMVTNVRRDYARSDSLPEGYGQYVVIALWLEAKELLSELDKRLPVYRRPGYVTTDAVMFVLAYFCSGARAGFRPFAEDSKPFGTELAAVFGRERWPTQSSMSRLLASMRMEPVKGFIEWLLTEISGKLTGPEEYTTYGDTQGQRWHVFHWDPTIVTLRTRALAEGDDLPEPQRRTDNIASPGYTGRKRGQKQVSRMTVQHAGSGLMVAATMEPGNGDLGQQLRDGLSGTVRFAKTNGIHLGSCVMCTDGVGGGYTQVAVLSADPVHYVTRYSKYGLLETVEAARTLRQTRWQAVDDSRSGPKRFAAELGAFNQDDIEMRIVVSRFRSRDTKTKKGSGVLIDGWQYELYATDLSASAFPASELVTLYYTRSGMENQFASENRELGANRLFHQGNPAGQLLVAGLALLVWNVRLQLGWRTVANDPLVERSQPPREIEEVDLEPPPPSEPPSHQSRSNSSAQLQESTSTTALQLRNLFIPALQMLDWKAKFADRPGWLWSSAQRALLCPAQSTLRLRRIQPLEGGKLGLWFRGTKGRCSQCTMRSSCSSSDKRVFRKEFTVVLTTHEAEILRRARAQPDAGKSSEVPEPTPAAEPNRQPGPYSMTAPLLLPAELRKRFSSPLSNSRTTVVIACPPKARPIPHYLALTPAIRQRRRKTWAERQKWNALPDKATVNITISTNSEAAELIGSLKTTPEVQMATKC